MELPSDGTETGDSSSEEDEETLLRLREAVDNKFILPNPSSVSTSGNQETKQPAIGAVTEENIAGADEDCKSLSDKIKTKLNNFQMKNTGQHQQPGINPKSLRRDRQDDVQLEVRSELKVTPQFQKFVGSKLDQLMSEQIEDISQKNILPREKDAEPSVKLLKRSRRTIEEKYSDNETKRRRPDLLAHKRIQPEDRDLSDLAVSGDFVRSQADTKVWVNRYPDRTEPGTQRIKRKKKKIKKKKKKSELSEAGCDVEVRSSPVKSSD